MTFDQHASRYAHGFAVGEANIRDDTMTFRFEDDMYTVQTIKAMPFTVRTDGPFYFYEIPIEKLRELAKE